MNDKGIERLRELFDQAEAQAQQKAHGGMFGSRISVQRWSKPWRSFDWRRGPSPRLPSSKEKCGRG